MSTAESFLAALEQYGLKQVGDGKYKSNAWRRPGSNSHAVSITIKDGEHGAWFDHVSGEAGTLYEGADDLGIARPTARKDEGSKRAYTDLADYADAHGAPKEAFLRAGWGEKATFEGRPALPFSTPTGTRHRFIDGKRPTYKSPTGYQRCWYRLQHAVCIAEATDQPLVICNGEASTVVGQRYGVAACAVTGGEKDIPAELVDELTATYHGPVTIALDSDPTGRAAAMQMLATLRASGFAVRAVDLNGHAGFDLADFAHLHREATPAALQARPDLSEATPIRRYRTEDEIDQLAPPTWLIKGIIPAGEVTMVSGPGDTGKTFMLLDLAKRVAQHYPVMYIAAEDASGIKIRKRAWELHHRRPKNGNFLMWEGVLPLFDGSEVEGFIDEVRGLGLRMIVVDTLSQSIAGADENSNGDMRIVLGHCQRIAHETGAAVVFIHHTTKNGDTFRGASALKNDSYAHLEVSRDDDLIRFECARIKNSKPFAPRYFKLVDVATDIADEEGTVMTSCVLAPAERTIIGDTLTRNQIAMLESLLLMTDAQGGAATTELQATCKLVGNSFYGALKRLRALGLVDKGAKRTDPLYVTAAGRARLARESQNPEHQEPGAALEAAPPFEVNTRLGQFLPLLPGSNSGSNVGGSNPIQPGQFLPLLPGSNGGSNVGGSSPFEEPSSQVATTPTDNRIALESPTTVATKLLPPATGSNGLLTTPSPPLLRGEGGSNGRSKEREDDFSHDKRREAEARRHLEAHQYQAARKAANRIRGRKECERLLEEIDAAEEVARAT